MANKKARGNFCLGQLTAGGLKPVSRQTGYDIPRSEAFAQATPYPKPSLIVEPANHPDAVDILSHDGTRGS
jgi:hypothetical protein